MTLNKRPKDSDIREQLARILASDDFEMRERVRKFLIYVVEEAISGRGDRIKALSVAIEVLGRDETFDPQNDPIVRMEARRLRRALERYYLTSGRDDPVIIDIPKGTYVPIFSYRDEKSSKGRTQKGAGQLRNYRAWLTRRLLARTTLFSFMVFAGAGTLIWIATCAGSCLDGFSLSLADNDSRASARGIPKILVVPFQDLGGNQSGLLATGLTEDMITRLSRFKELAVMGRETSWMISPAPDSIEAGQKLGPDYILTGGVQGLGNKARISTRLLDAREGTVMWAQSNDINLDIADLFTAQEKIVDATVTVIAQPYGILYTTEKRRSGNLGAESVGAYECVLQFYNYRTILSEKQHALTRDCLEGVVKSSPNFATAWGMLAYIYLDEYRFHYNTEADFSSSFDRSTDAAERAIRLEPDNVRANQALMTVLFFKHDINAALEVGEAALKLNPNDTELLAEFGTRLAIGRDWAQGEKLIRQALERNPGHSGYYHTMLALTAAMLQDYDQALKEIELAGLNSFSMFHAIALGIFGRFGMKEEALQARQRLEALYPGFTTNIVNEMRRRGFREVDRAEMYSNLRKAGLVLPPEGDVLADRWDKGELTKKNRWPPR